MTDTVITPQPTPLRILLVGDNCLDVYWFGVVDRISPEAPVPVFQYKYTEQHAGMAGNVLRNLETLGCEVTYVHKETATKTRLIDLRSTQQVVRIDNDVAATPLEFADLGNIDYNAVVVSDYNKGTITYELIEQLIGTKLPVFSDTKTTDLKRCEGAWVKIKVDGCHCCFCINWNKCTWNSFCIRQYHRWQYQHWCSSNSHRQHHRWQYSYFRIWR